MLPLLLLLIAATGVERVHSDWCPIGKDTEMSIECLKEKDDPESVNKSKCWKVCMFNVPNV